MNIIPYLIKVQKDTLEFMVELDLQGNHTRWLMVVTN